MYPVSLWAKCSGLAAVTHRAAVLRPQNRSEPEPIFTL